MRGGEDRFLRDSIEHQSSDLARAGGQSRGSRELGPERVEVGDPVKRAARKQLPRRLVQHLHPAVAVYVEKSARRIVDDRG